VSTATASRFYPALVDPCHRIHIRQLGEAYTRRCAPGRPTPSGSSTDAAQLLLVGLIHLALRTPASSTCAVTARYLRILFLAAVFGNQPFAYELGELGAIFAATER